MAFLRCTKVGSKKYYIDESAGYIYIVLKTSKASVEEDETYTVRHILVAPRVAAIHRQALQKKLNIRMNNGQQLRKKLTLFSLNLIKQIKANMNLQSLQSNTVRTQLQLHQAQTILSAVFMKV